jgi:O-antigen biosynthesis protein
MATISCITTMYNQWETSLEHLWHLNTLHNLEDVEVIAVDDGSTDGTKKGLAKFMSNAPYDFEYVSFKENKGLSAAINAGIRASTGKLICIWSNDVLPSPHCLEILFEFLYRNPDYGMIEGTMVLERQMSKTDFFNNYMNKDFHNNIRNSGEVLLWGNNQPYFLWRDVVDEIGLFDENYYPMAYEDWDYCIRLAQAGYKFGQNTRAFLFHYESLTKKAIVTSGTHPGYEMVNRRKFYDKWNWLFQKHGAEFGDTLLNALYAEGVEKKS